MGNDATTLLLPPGLITSGEGLAQAPSKQQQETEAAIEHASNAAQGHMIAMLKLQAHKLVLWTLVDC